MSLSTQCLCWVYLSLTPGPCRLWSNSVPLSPLRPVTSPSHQVSPWGQEAHYHLVTKHYKVLTWILEYTEPPSSASFSGLRAPPQYLS